MRLQPFLITSILAVGLAMPAIAQQPDSTRRSAINAAFETYRGGRRSLIAECRPSCGVPNNPSCSCGGTKMRVQMH
jgi:hypothetical protein